jgi:hypothetical protein
MNQNIQSRFQWTADQLQISVTRAMRAHYGSELHKGMTILMLLGLFLFNGSVFGQPDGRDVIRCWVGLSLFLSAGISLVALSIWIRKRAAPVANRMEWVEWSFTPEGVTRQIGTQAPAERPWGSAAECVRMPDGFVLRFRMGAKLGMQWLPLDGFGNPEDAAAFSEWAQCRVKKYRTQGMIAKPGVRVSSNWSQQDA